MDITGIISIAVFALSVISSIVSIVISKFKAQSKVDDYKSKTERIEKIVELVSEIIPKAITFAEKSGNSGENKKLLAQSKILIDCMNNGIDYTGLSENIDKAIEDLINFSKEVNAVSVKKEV